MPAIPSGESMRSRPIITALMVVASTAMFAAPVRASILVNIDKSSQTMTVTVDGTQRYAWPISTGRPGYDTPNGTFKPNRMDADHMSQEWDNAPMPHSIFFDMNGHAIHGFFDVSHIGSPVSHGCVRLSPAHAATLYDLISKEGMKETTVVVTGHIPAGRSPQVARRSGSAEEARGRPMRIAPGYAEQAPRGYYAESAPAVPPPPLYAGRSPQGYYGQQRYYDQRPYAPPQYFLLQPYGQY